MRKTKCERKGKKECVFYKRVNASVTSVRPPVWRPHLTLSVAPADLLCATRDTLLFVI